MGTMGIAHISTYSVEAEVYANMVDGSRRCSTLLIFAVLHPNSTESTEHKVSTKSHQQPPVTEGCADMLILIFE